MSNPGDERSTIAVKQQYKLCSCGSGTKATFYCDDESCKDHKQRIFCFDCVFKKRLHVGHKNEYLEIDKAVDQIKEKWKEHSLKFEELYTNTKQPYTKI